MPFDCFANGKLFLKREGFAVLILIPFLSLMIFGFSGLFLMGFGIKNLTRAQTACIKSNLKGQKKLGRLLEMLLQLNKVSKKLHQKRIALKTAIVVAIAHGNIKAVSLLKKVLKLLKYKQKLVLVRQKSLLLKSRKIKIETLRDLRRSLSGLKIKNLYEVTFFKKALAVEKKKIGDSAYAYTPVADFSKKQSTVFSWRIDLLAQKKATAPLSSLFFKSSFFGKYSCSATLERSQNIWKAHLLP